MTARKKKRDVLDEAMTDAARKTARSIDAVLVAQARDGVGFDGETRHYGSGVYEVINIIEHFKFGFHLGNAFKYMARAGKKPGGDELKDLDKCIYYLKRQRDKRAKEMKK